MITDSSPWPAGMHRTGWGHLTPQVISRSRDLGLLQPMRTWPVLSPFHPVGAMPLRATRWILRA